MKTERAEKKRGRTRTFKGTVVRKSGDKSAVISIEKMVVHPKYKKSTIKKKRLMFHDEENLCGIGDTVRIVESRPISKRKRFRLLELVTKAKI